MSNNEDNRYPRPYVPVLKLQGSSYEIGYQQGEMAKAQIDSNVRTYTAFFKETAGISWDEAKERSTIFIPTLEKLYPEILEEIQGIADGSQLSREGILAINVRSEIALTNYEEVPSQEPPQITDGCTGFAQLSKDGSKFVLAQNWDWLEELHNGMVFMDITTKDGTRLKFFNEAGLVGKIGMNSFGFGLCNNALRSGSKNTDRLPTHIMSRRLLQYAKSFEEAVQMLEDYGGACTCNYIIGDSTGKFADIELSPKGISMIKPLSSSETGSPSSTTSGAGPSFVAHTNHVISPPTSFPRGSIYDHPAPNSFSRLARITTLIQDDLEKDVSLNTESAFERLKDQEGTPYSICRNKPPGAQGMEKMTTLASVVMEFDVRAGKGKGKGTVFIGRPCEEGLQKVEWNF